jgi:hypothetical protein
MCVPTIISTIYFKKEHSKLSPDIVQVQELSVL